MPVPGSNFRKCIGTLCIHVCSCIQLLYSWKKGDRSFHPKPTFLELEMCFV